MKVLDLHSQVRSQIMKLSVVMPIYNERNTLRSVIERVLYFLYSVGNWILTVLSNCLTYINLSDMETCYKAFRREVIQSIPIEENRFGFEPEITVKVAKRRLRIYEVGISYWGRTYEEGKKIGWKDGVRPCCAFFNFSSRNRLKPRPTAELVSGASQKEQLSRAEK